MRCAVVVAGLLLGACDGTGDATLRFTAWGEEYIEDRIPAADFDDGWEVTFDVFDVEISGVVADGETLPGRFVVDLASPSNGAGHTLGTMVVPASGSPMVSWSIDAISVRGHATRAEEDGTATMKAFDWSFVGPMHYLDCDTGTPLSEGETTDVVLTVHADHLFYDDLDSETPNVVFDLIAASDADEDGDVTMGELEQMSITGQTRYQVGGRDISDLRAFIEAQAPTVGHINGEGHCEIE